MRRILQLGVLTSVACVGALAQCSNTSYGNGFVCVQAAGNALGGAGNVTTANFPVDTTVGNVVVFYLAVCADEACTTDNAPSITLSQDNAGSNVCTEIPGGPFEVAQNQTQISRSTKMTAYVCPITTPNKDWNARATGGTPFYLSGYAAEWSGVATTGFYDKVTSGIAATGGETSASLTTTSTANAVDLVVGMLGTSDDTISAGAGFLEVLKVSNYVQMEAKSVATQGAQTCTWTNAAGSWQGMCITLKSTNPAAEGVVWPYRRAKFRSGGTLPPYIYVDAGDPLVGVDNTKVGWNNPNMPTPPSASGGYTGGGVQKTFSACTPSNDDAPAVLAMWNSMSSGDYMLMTCVANVGAGGLTLPSKTNVKLYGAGSGGFKSLAVTGIQSVGGFNRPGFVKITCTDCLIYNLDFNVNNIATSGLLIDSSTRVEVRHVSVHDAACVLQDPNNCYGTAGIVGDGNTSNRYIDNYVYNMGGAGPSVNGIRGQWNRETGPLIWASTFYNTGGTGSGCNCSNAEWGYNYMHNTNAAGIKLSGAGSPAWDNVGSSSMHHNLLDNATQIRLENTATSTALLIYHNELRNLADGIYANGGPMNNTQITHNYFHDNSSASVKLLSTLSAFVIQDNQIYSSAYGIHIGEVGGSFTTVTINRNDLKGNTYGIKFQNSGSVTSGVTISNSALTAGTHGLHIDSGIAGTITESTNCWHTNSSSNITDGRGIIPNPPPNGPCANPVQ